MAKQFLRVDPKQKQIKRVFDRIIAAVDRPEAAMRQMSLTFADLVRNTFRKEQDPWGAPWPQHSPVTLEMRRRRGDASIQMLVARPGNPESLFGSIKAQNTASSASVSLGGNEDNFPEVHQFGNPSNRMFGGPLAPIPARPFLPIDQDGSTNVPRDWFIELLAPLERFLDDLDRR